MDLNVHESDAHPGDLLEDCWFFGNLLQRKSRMLRSYSDPCTCSNYTPDNNLPGKSYEETYASIKNEELRRAGGGGGGGGRQSVQVQGVKGGDPRKSKPDGKLASGNMRLVRAPSLPTSLEKDDEEEIEFSMGKLIRQASMNHRDNNNLPPRQQQQHSSAKGLTPSSSVSRQRSRRKSETESIKLEAAAAGNLVKTQKSFSAVDFNDIQGLKDMGYDFDKRSLSPDVVSIENEDRMARRAAWGVPPPPPQVGSAPPVPKWGGKRTNEDMKAQIKFWARAVASNVRQEC
ncbi:hypothetical protein Salat_1989200 [Sesamum alatum]|uniref:Uncharacterized protein n=1 Tax=Sesamum alatum TaxID=300844 RepID=A0AAE1XZB5_9LAMI|nr:hypothetical protein Salat_1989200 [Sesamum alatum]